MPIIIWGVLPTLKILQRDSILAIYNSDFLPPHYSILDSGGGGAGGRARGGRVGGRLAAGGGGGGGFFDAVSAPTRTRPVP